MAFAYDQSRLESARHGISLSLPPSAGFSNAFSDGFFKGTHRERKVSAFFSVLLPDGSMRARLADCPGISENNPFALLEIVDGEAPVHWPFIRKVKSLPKSRKALKYLMTRDLKRFWI